MKFTTFCLIMTAAFCWSILPSWAQMAEKTPKAKVAKEIPAVTSDPGSPEQPGLAKDGIGLLCQMGGGMMRGGGQCAPGAGMGPGPQGAQNLNSGADIFAANCAGCHPGGGNNVIPNLPIRGSAQLKDFNTFRSYIGSPTLPNGAHGPMPGFSSDQISNRQMRTLYQYLKSRWGG
jgi:mono/diheme cytochrome c family protein